jgi:hypothetical protein
MKAVPLIRTLPQSEQIEMYSLLQHQEFQDGEYIIRQGDVGDKFYIITDGAADVIEESYDSFHFRREVLTRLYEGHFFGEMAIIYDEPRSLDDIDPSLTVHQSSIRSSSGSNFLFISFQGCFSRGLNNSTISYDDAGFFFFHLSNLIWEERCL